MVVRRDGFSTVARCSARAGERVWGRAPEGCACAITRRSKRVGRRASGLQIGSFYPQRQRRLGPLLSRPPHGQIDGVYTLKGVEEQDWEEMAAEDVEGKSYVTWAT